MSAATVVTGRPSRSPSSMSAGQAHHLAVVVDDLADDADGGESGELHEVDRRLGVAVALAHAAVDRAQRQDVAGSDAADAGVDAGSASTRSVCARSAALMPVDVRSAASTVIV